MDAWRFILASLRHYRRIHVAVALGVAVATAVLTGALLVGDSVRGSLRDLTLERLGRIDAAVVGGRPFRAQLADELAADAGFKKYFAAAEPALLLNGSLQAGSGKDARRATQISIVGCEPEFWSLGSGGPAKPLASDEVALTEPVARELGVNAGDTVLLRVPTVSAIPADSTLGKKSETASGRTMKVAEVLPTEGLARFGLAPSQQFPRNVFVPLVSLQQLLKQPGKANAILVAANEVATPADEDAKLVIERALRPSVTDFGVNVAEIAAPTKHVQISASQLVLPDEVVRAAEKSFGPDGIQPVVTYLANTISSGEGAAKRKIPYSTVVGVDSKSQLGPLLDEGGGPISLADGEIVLNRWAADDLGVKVGDLIELAFYDPESTHGTLHEHTPAPRFKLRTIAELKTTDGKPTAAADPKLAPELPGVTDQKSINDWDLPFELTETIRAQDENYWHEYRTTPKAFVSLAAAKRLWTSRWGTISLLRLPAGDLTAEAASARVRQQIGPASLGWSVLPVKELGLAASAGTTPFEALFLGFSFFLIAAAVMLVSLLFQLGVEQRARELGTLTAVGVGRPRITRLLSAEGLTVAAVGATVGVLLGVGYAWLMVFGLRTWWLAAISTPFLQLHVSWFSLMVGWLAGLVVSWLTIRWSIRRLVRLPGTRLLAGITTGDLMRGLARSPFRIWPIVRVVLIVLVIGQGGAGFFLRGEAQAGVFFGSGAVMLALLLGEVRYRLQRAALVRASANSFSLARLSAWNTARNSGRSTLTIGLVAAASFLIIAVSAFHLNTGEGGTGGFQYIAASDLPVHYDLNTVEGRRELGFADDANRQLESWRVFALRVADGENASCLNLYQPQQPRVLGVPRSLIDRGGFAWSATKDGFAERPWDALDTELGKDAAGHDVVPVVLDMSTALYSLHLSGVGSQLKIRDSADREVTLQIVGLLENSVLQGNALVSEGNFLKLFPDAAGYRFFLIERREESPSADQQIVQRGSSNESDAARNVPSVLEATLAEEGLDVQDANEQLAQFLAVQNTYLSTFQSLGGLGLLLGTVGLAVVQLRSVLERRGELALMRAGGFRAGRLVRMVIFENAVLLLGGLAVGGIAAIIALVPQWLPHAASVPWATLAALLGTIAVVGLVAGWLATRSVLRAPIVAALRGD